MARLPMKEQHPDWILKDSWWGGGLWNFAVPEVQDYKVAIFREVAENYDYDGISVDFGRHPPALPIGEQWAHHEAMTNFIRKVRLMLQEVAEKRGRPFLLAVRVGASPAGCHYDGLDVETWVRQNLVDIIIIGVRSTKVEIGDFRSITEGTYVKVYPCIDDIHSPGGYHHPPIEFFRGLAINWWKQGADSIVTFNFSNESAAMAPTIGMSAFAPHQQAYHEIGDPELIRFKDKMFVIGRRYGAGWDKLPSGWGTLPDATKHIWDFYQNMNHEASLPVALPANGYPVIESLYVGDDIAGNSERVESVELRTLLSGAAAEDVVEVKLNGILLTAPTMQDDGWRIFTLRPRYFAVGENLVSARAAAAQGPITIEKLEVHVNYKD